MADTVQPSQPFDAASVQIAPSLGAGTSRDQLVFLSEIARANGDDGLLRDSDARTESSAEAFSTEDLLNLGLPAETPDDLSTLSILNEFGGETNIVNADGMLNAGQLQELATLQRDAALLQQATGSLSAVPANDEASTVNLSAEAEALLAGSGGSVNGAPPLNTAQLTQIREVIAPVADDPLTADLLARIQAQLEAQGLPVHLTLTTLSHIMNFIAGFQPDPKRPIENRRVVGDDDL